jgi:hypothetical protein
MDAVENRCGFPTICRRKVEKPPPDKPIKILRIQRNIIPMVENTVENGEKSTDKIILYKE